MKFTDRYIQKLAPQEKRFEVREGDGFVLRVTPAGTKSFYYVYRSGGKLYRLCLGTWPHVTLSDAREKHRAALSQRHQGENPVEAKKEGQQARAAAPTVAELAKDYIEKHAKPNKKSWEKDQYILDKDVLPVWGERKAAEITRRDVIVLLEGIVERGAPNQSNQVLKIIRRMFNFALERVILESSPCHMIKPLSPKISKERALSDVEIKIFWDLLRGKETRISEVMRRGLLLILVTAQRPGECFGIRRAEIDGDWWTIPAERAKNKREHRVYLTPLAKSLIPAGDKDVIFPGKKTGEPMGEEAPGRAVLRLFKKTKKAGPRLQFPPFTPHDLRRTAATHLGASGYDNPKIARLLNHVDFSVTATYNRHRYDSLVKRMLLIWERNLLEILQDSTSL